MGAEAEELEHWAWDDREIEPAPADIPRSAPVGVGGWLLFLCVSLSIISPLATLVVFPISVSQYAPYFDRFPGLLVATVISGVLGAVVMAALVYSGTGLWKLRSHAVRTAKTMLLLVLVAQVLNPMLVFFAGLGPEANRVMIAPSIFAAARGAVYPLVWFIYLTRSRRVAATYAEAVSQPVEQVLPADAPES